MVAEYQDHVERCTDCGATLVSGEASIEAVSTERTDPLHAGPPPVVLRAFLHLAEAYVYHSRLEAEGIPAFVADERMGTLEGAGAPQLGGVRLLVADAERAESLLQEMERGDEGG